MSVPVHTLNKEQKIWYSRMVIGAILADDEISPSEIDFLKQVVAVVDTPAEKKELMQMISSKNKPSLVEPPGIGKEILAAVFVELLLIMISDLDFADKEKEFMKEVSQLFGLKESYFIELMNWAEEGLQWKESQRQLIPGELENESFQVPISSLSSEQKLWYSQTLIATIMLDGMVDEMELSFLKAAISIVDNRKYQKQLMGYVRNKMAPPLQVPPEFSPEVLVLIVIEVMRILSADESLSYTEQTHLKNISDLCGFSSELFDSMLNWCQRGLSWMRNKNPLIARCQLAPKSQIAKVTSLLEDNPDNNSILDRDFECFICESDKKVKAFQLKPHSHEPNRNIFGITTYLESLKGYDYIDYNLVRISVCPDCFFASINKDMFRKNDKELVPAILANPKFKNFWQKDIEKRKSMFKNKPNEISSVPRSVPMAIKTYQLALKVSNALGKLDGKGSFQWETITLLLTLSEITMSSGNEKKGEEFLRLAQEKADSLFKQASSNDVSFRTARLLFFIALYNNDLRAAGPYLDFLRGFHQEKADSLKPQERSLLKKIYGEAKNALGNRSEYKKERLIGFHLDV